MGTQDAKMSRALPSEGRRRMGPPNATHPSPHLVAVLCIGQGALDVERHLPTQVARMRQALVPHCKAGGFVRRVGRQQAKATNGCWCVLQQPVQAEVVMQPGRQGHSSNADCG